MRFGSSRKFEIPRLKLYKYILNYNIGNSNIYNTDNNII